jgi:rubrerythrin
MKKNLFLSFLILMAFGACTSKSQLETINNIKLGVKTAETAKAKYTAYAVQARKENHILIGKLFDAASKAEDIHANNHEIVLKTYKAPMDEFTPTFQVKTTAENLQDAIDGTAYEIDSIFPIFIKDATSKKLKKVTINSLTWSLAAEKVHIALFKEALNALKMNKENTLPLDYLVCPICGETYNKAKVSENCFICGASKEIFLGL